MHKQSHRRATFSFLWSMFRIFSAGLTLVVLIFWFFSRRSILELSNYLFMGGAISVLVGLILLAGGWGSTKSFRYQYGSSAGPEDLRERSRFTFLELLSMYDLTIQIWIAGTLLILASVLVGQWL